MEKLVEGGAGVVLLGLSDQTVPAIRALNREYGTVPTLFAERRPLRWPLWIKYRFVHCRLPGNSYYLLHAVLDMVAAPHDVRTILVPCTSQFQNIMSKNIEIFEKEYIIRGIEQLLPLSERRTHA